MTEQLPVNELFETIQGEATFTGTPAVFIRLQGCPVGCAFCDTKHTWTIDPRNAVTMDEVLSKSADAPSFAWMGPVHIAEIAARHKSQHIVITGGEPCLYDLWPLTSKLITRGLTVQIETSGTSEIKCAGGTFVTLSPKIGMPGGKEVLDSAIARADEIKMPVGKMADIDKLRAVMDRVKDARQKHDRDVINGGPTVWLQPLSQSPKATELCVEMATLNGWKLSVQTHKYLGVR